jgi:hypothetical protein
MYKFGESFILVRFMITYELYDYQCNAMKTCAVEKALDQVKGSKFLTFWQSFGLRPARCSTDFSARFSLPSPLTMSNFLYVCGKYHGHYHGLDLILNCRFPLPVIIILTIVLSSGAKWKLFPLCAMI